MPQLVLENFAPQIVWLAITFIALYLMMWRVIGPRIASVLEERQSKIQHDLDQAAEHKAETETAIAEYEAALAEARDKSQRMIAEMRVELAADGDRRRAEVEAQIAKRTETVEAELARARDQALAELGQVAREAASAVVERLTGSAPDGGAVGQAVDRAQES